LLGVQVNDEPELVGSLKRSIQRLDQGAKADFAEPAESANPPTSIERHFGPRHP
jgi:hypothetical protein